MSEQGGKRKRGRPVGSGKKRVVCTRKIEREKGKATHSKTTHNKTTQDKTRQHSIKQHRTPYHLSQDTTSHHTTPIPHEIFLFTTAGRKVSVSPGRVVLVQPGESIDWLVSNTAAKLADGTPVVLTTDDIAALRDKLLGYDHAWIDDEYATVICDIVRSFTSEKEVRGSD